MSDQQSNDLLVFGLDEHRRARAGKFPSNKAEEAAARAKASNLVTATVEGSKLRALSAEIPDGDLAKDGPAFIPIISRATYQRLLTAAGLLGPHKANEKRDSNPLSPADTALHRPQSWDDIQTSSFVLAEDPEPKNGWYEAVVMERHEGQTITVRFRDYPEEGLVTRDRHQVAFLPPVKP